MPPCISDSLLFSLLSGSGVRRGLNALGRALARRFMALWSFFLTLWHGSFLFRLGDRFFARCARLWRGSGLVRLCSREGFFARLWRDSFLCRLVGGVADLPAMALRWLYRAGEPLWEGSRFARLAFGLGDQVPLFAALGLAGIMSVPYLYWDNANSLLLTLLLFLLFLAGAMRTHTRRLDMAAIPPYAFLFWGAVLVSVVFSDYRWLSARFLWYHIPCFLLTLVLVSALEHTRQLLQVAAGLACGVLISSLYGLYQRFVLKISLNPSYVDMSLNEGMPGRVYSFYENPNAFGEVLLFLLPVIVALFFAAKTPRTKIFAGLVFCVGGAAMLMTGSRASWVGLAAAALVYVFLWNRRLLPLCLLAAVCALPVLPQTVLNRFLTIFNTSDTSTSSRFPIYKAAIQLLRRQPLMGVGLGVNAVQARIQEFRLYDATATFVHAHNTYLQLWLETGLLGLCALLGQVLWTVKATARAVRESANVPARHMAIGGSAALCGALVCGLADYLWNYPRVMFLFWAVCALTLGALKICRKDCEAA